MDLNFISDPGLIPQPRERIRIENLAAQPYEDGHRVRLEIRLTPFRPADRPSLEITTTNPEGRPISLQSIIETVHNEIGITIHLREPTRPHGVYTFHADLYYEEGVIQHSADTSVTLPPDGAGVREHDNHSSE